MVDKGKGNFMVMSKMIKKEAEISDYGFHCKGNQ